MIKCSSDDLSAHIPHQLKVKIWSHKYFYIALLLKGTAELNEMFSGGYCTFLLKVRLKLSRGSQRRLFQILSAGRMPS